MKPIGTLLAIFVLLVVAMTAYYFSGTQTRKRDVSASLERFSQAVATKDRAKVTAALTELLTDDAHIHLSVYFFSIGNTRPTMEQDFDKAQFIAFIDNVLYPLTDYSYTPNLVSISSGGDAVFNSVEWADGANMMGGISIAMRYGSDTSCTGNVIFDPKPVKLQKANCTLQLKQMPKPGQEGKLMNLKSLNDLLGQHP